MERLFFILTFVFGAITLIGLLLPVRRKTAAVTVDTDISPTDPLFVKPSPTLFPRRPLFIVASLLPFAFFLLSLPAQKPFSPGGGLGFGLLIGGIAALLGILLGRFVAPKSDGHMLSAHLVFAPMAAALPVLLLRGSLMDTLCGVALGWITVALLAAIDGYEADPDFLLPIATGAGYAVIVCALAAFGAYRDAASPLIVKGHFPGTGLMMGALVPMLTFSATFLNSPTRLRDLFLYFNTSIYLLVLLGVHLVLENKGIHFGNWIEIIIGFVLGNIMYDLLFKTPKPNSILALLALAAALMVAMQSQGGYDASMLIVILCGLPLFAVALGNKTGNLANLEPMRRYIPLLLFAVAVVLFRWLNARWGGDLKNAPLTDSYALFALLIGAFLPTLLANMATRRNLLSVAAAAVLGIAAPVALVIVWGIKCVLGLEMGFAVGIGIQSNNNDGENDKRRTIIASLFAVAIGLVMVQLLGHLLPYGDLSRVERIRAVAWVTGIAAVFVIVSEIANRRPVPSTTNTVESKR